MANLPERGSDEERKIRDTAIRVQSDWQGRNDRITDARTARFNLAPPKAPPEAIALNKLPAPKIPLVGELINAAQGLTAALPLPRRDALDPNDPADNDASARIERGLISGGSQLFGYPNNVWPKITDAGPIDGQAVWKTILDRHKFYVRRQKDEEDSRYLARVKAERRDNFPFVSEHVDTMCYFPIAKNARGRVVKLQEITERELGDVYEQFNNQVDMSWLNHSGHMTDTCKLIETWTETDFSYTLEHAATEKDGLILAKNHPYKRVPYFDPEFSTTSMKDRKFQTVGLADNLVGLQNLIESIELMDQAYEFWSAYPMFTLVPVGDEYMPIKGDMTFQAVPLGTVKAPPGYKWVPVQMPGFGEGLIRHREFLMGLADDVRLAPILQGRIEHAQSGPTTSTQLDTAKARFGVWGQNLSGALNDHAAHLLYCVEKVLRAPVPTAYTVTEDAEKKKHGQWDELAPKDIAGYYTVDYQVEPTTRLERNIRTQQATNLQAAGMVSKRYALEEAGIHDPASMLREVDTEDLSHSPEARTAIIQEMSAEFHELVAQELGTPAGAPPMMAGAGIPQLAGIQQPLMPGVLPDMSAAIPPGINPAPPMGPPI